MQIYIVKVNSIVKATNQTNQMMLYLQPWWPTKSVTFTASYLWNSRRSIHLPWHQKSEFKITEEYMKRNLNNNNNNKSFFDRTSYNIQKINRHNTFVYHKHDWKYLWVQLLSLLAMSSFFVVSWRLMTLISKNKSSMTGPPVI